MIEQHLYTLITIILLMALWVMFFTLHRGYHIARTRQRLFSIRTELFIAAANGKISFDDPGYRQVRLIINGTIKFTHNLSIFRTIAIVVFNQYAHQSLYGHFSAHLNNSLAKLTAEQRGLLQNTIDKVHLQVVRHLMSVSLFWPIFKLLSVIFKVMRATKAARKWATSGSKQWEWRRFDAEVTYNTSCKGAKCGAMLAA